MSGNDIDQYNMAATFDEFVVGNHMLLILCWSCALYKIPHKSRVIAYSSSCTAPNISINLAHCLTTFNLISCYNIRVKNSRDK